MPFYHRLLSKAGQHKLMVNLHGAFPPAGFGIPSERGAFNASFCPTTTSVSPGPISSSTSTSTPAFMSTFARVNSSASA